MHIFSCFGFKTTNTKDWVSLYTYDDFDTVYGKMNLKFE